MPRQRTSPRHDRNGNAAGCQERILTLVQKGDLPTKLGQLPTIGESHGRFRAFHQHTARRLPAVAAMIGDMTIRRLSDHTKRDYVRQVSEFTAFFGRAQD